MKKTKFSHKVLAVFLTLTFLPSVFPFNYVYASNNGPNAPEAASFEPVDATDMVNLVSGDVSYVLPLLDMDGFPLTLSYHAGIPLDMESSWTGLGWNVNSGAISRSVSGTPDDWKDGNSLDFIYFRDSEEFYNINVGVGISQAAEVGVGISWGSNKSLSGSVYGSFMMVNASINTDGAYYAGIGVGAGNGNYGGSLSVGVSGNVNGGASYVNAGIGVGASTNSGARASLGYSLTDNSVSLSGGYGNRTAFDKGQAGGGGVSMRNYSAGDYDISEKGFFVPVQIWIFSLSFGYRKVTYQLDKGYPKLGNGTLYAGNASLNASEMAGQDGFTDLQNRYKYTDVYEEAIPSKVEEFITDYESEREKVNFSFASYDNYAVNATGMSGVMQPKIFENATLFGLGYAGKDTDNTNRNMRVYYHNQGSSTKTFGQNATNGSDDTEFYFNGQFTENITTPTRTLNNGAANGFEDYLQGSGDKNNSRQRSGNFVEVFTNQQLASGSHTGIMMPENPASGTIPADGIGAYKITAPDGKTYHYSLPVYHYEQVERNLIKQSFPQDDVNEKRQYTPYATHWLLTAITGPDFVDVNNDNKPNDGDYGYWVRMDHGQWSDGFVWRSPYYGKKYNTNLAGEIETKDFGNYQYGRKQLYYLDKIVTREHTAYFVKDLRYDGTGAHGYNEYSNTNLTTYEYSFNGADQVENDVDGGSEWVRENLEYKREYQLLLDKIVVVENDGNFLDKNSNPAASMDDGTCFPGYVDDDTCDPKFDPRGGFDFEYGSNYEYDIHQEKKVYDVTDFEDFDYTKAHKVVDLSYSYDLAKNTPSSMFCEGYGGGRLTLAGVYFRGKGDYGFMPPYRFAYKNEMSYPSLNRYKISASNYRTDQAKDGWGFIDETQVADKVYNSTDYDKYGPDNWSLSEITTPTGGKIKIEFEEDDYESEAFSRKLWQDNLMFSIEEDQRGGDCGIFTYTTHNSDEGPCKYRISVKNVNNLNPEAVTDFKEYFEIGEKVYLDLWIGLAKNPNSDLSGTTHHAYFNLPGSGVYIRDLDLPYDPYYNEFFGPDDRIHTDVTVLDVTEDNVLVLDFNLYNFEHTFIQTNSNVDEPFIGVYDGADSFPYFGKDGTGSHVYDSRPRGIFPPDLNGGGFHHTMSYRLLANKVPQNVQGGGLRAKSIIVSDENGREYKTNYYYNKPGTAKYKNDPNYRSSGITSFAPENGIKFIPYQSELPSPGVMYEYVTMVPVSTNGKELGSTRYRFHTLDPVFDLFDPNIEMKYESEVVNNNTGLVEKDSISIFRSKVTDFGNGGYFDSANKTYAKQVDLKVNTALTGQFRSIETFNVEGHLMSKTQKLYESSYVKDDPQGIPQSAKVIPGRGTIKESFQTMKSVFTTDGNDNNPILKNRYISISSKEDFTNVLNQVRTTTGGFTATEKYEDGDYQTGAFRTTWMTKADGTEVRTRQMPAYSQYPDMGSKVDNINNKHMLTQKMMTVSDVKVAGSWKTAAASVNTWSDKTLYDNAASQTSDGIWRKHQNFIWKDDVAADGTFGRLLSDNDFNWDYEALQTNTQWQKISETTRYNHWSSPLEVLDINQNYLATKMGDDNKKIFATSNAGYNELFYSGAEDLQGNTLGGHVGLGTSIPVTDQANVHTGNNALSIASGQTGYVVSVTEGKQSDYKASLWAKFGTHNNLGIQVGSAQPIAFNASETVRAGDWIQLNFYFQVNGTETISVTNSGTTSYIDDFRLHPVASKMTSYVYNEFDELTYVLGGNNMATQYQYDDAGRLSITKTEVEDFDDPGSGGFKKVGENKYTYKY